MNNSINRRNFLKANASALTGLALTNMMPSRVFAQEDKPVRIGFVGTGNRCRGLMNYCLSIKGVQVPAVCDIDHRALQAAQDIVTRTRCRISPGANGKVVNLISLWNLKTFNRG